VFKKLIIIALTLPIGLSAAATTPPEEDRSILQWAMPESYFQTNRFTQPEDPAALTQNAWLDSVDTIEVARNEALILSVDPTLLSLYVTQRSTGYVWSSTLFKDYAARDADNEPLYPELTSEGDRGLRSTLWRNRVDSPIWLRYYTAGASPQLRDETLFDASASTFTFTLVDEGFSSRLFFAQAQVALTLEVTLTERGLNVVIPPESIEERGDQRLGQLAVYPFFGAAKQEEIPGYFMVPDGSGALIRWNPQTFHTIFEKPYYGQDLSVALPSPLTDGLKRSKALTAPVFGMVHGVDQQGFLTVMHSAETYASLVLYPGTVTTDFNFAYINYTFRTSYRQPLNQSQTNTILRVQSDRNPVSIHQEWIFLADQEANYVGMARAYRAVLAETLASPLPSLPSQSLHLDILMSENEPAFIGRNTFVMTHVNDIKAWVEALQAQGFDHLVLSLRGTSRNGFSGQSLQEFPVGSHLGTQAEFEALFALPNVSVYLYVEPTKIYPFTAASRRYAVSVGRHLLTYRQQDAFGVFDRIHPVDMKERVQDLAEEATAFGFAGLMLDTLGHTVYASFGDRPFSRLAMQDSVSALVAGHAVMAPFAHAFEASALMDMPLDHSLNQSFSDGVPFLTYALQGLRPQYAGFLNYSANFTLERLRMLDYHVFPSYFVTEESAYALLRSPSRSFYTSAFDNWSEVMIESEQDFRAIQAAIHDLQIARREVLDTGVVLITYDTGTQVLINYRSVPYQDTTWDVPSQSASLREVRP